MENTWYNVLITCVFLTVGSVLNLVVLLLTLLTPSLRTINNEFICHTTAVSLAGCSVLFSMSLVEMTTSSPHVTLSEDLCRAEQIVGILCFSAGSSLLFFFGLYRFMSAVRPLTTLIHVRLNTLRVALLIPWVFAGFVSFLLNIDLTRQCQFGDWTNIERSVFIGFFSVVVAVPVLCLSVFFLAIIMKTRENRRKNAEVQVYYEHQIMKSVTSTQTQGDLVIRNPGFDDINNLKDNKWDVVGDLTRLSLNSTDQLAALRRRSSTDSSSRSSDSIFDNLDGNDDDRDQDSFTADGSGSEISDDENDIMDIPHEEKIEKDSDLSRNDTSSKMEKSMSSLSISESDKNSDIELDFILPQHESEDFMKDMMAALHKSFRESKHSIASRTSVESINFEGSVSSTSSNRLPTKPTDRAVEGLSKILTRNMSRSESRADSENKTFDVEELDSDFSLPGTPTFHPPPPPQQSSPHQSIRKDSKTPSDGFDTELEQAGSSPPELTKLDNPGSPPSDPCTQDGNDIYKYSYPTARQQPTPSPRIPFPGDPPPLPSQPPPLPSQPPPLPSQPPPLPSQPPPPDRPPPLPSQPPPTGPPPGVPPPLPDRPPPGDTPPSVPRPSRPAPAPRPNVSGNSTSSSHSTDSFQKADSKDGIPTCSDQPIDKWLLERIRSIESTKSEQRNPSIGNIRENSLSEPCLGNASLNNTSTSRGTAESFSEGYSTNVLLLIYTILFLLFQVQHAIVTLHVILTAPGSPADTAAADLPLHSTISYTLHLVYYTLTPVVTLSICKPLKTVLYNRAVQMGVFCVDSIDWCGSYLSLDRA